MMNTAELIYESVKRLPSPAAQEVLDFAYFLALRERCREDRELMLAQQSATDDWDNEDDDSWNHAPTV